MEHLSSGRALFSEQLPQLPIGVEVRSLKTNIDERGSLTELFRDSWIPDLEIIQWNHVTSAALVMRGVHVHLKHWDYLICTGGRILVGLVDLRHNSPTERLSVIIEMSPKDMSAITIPPGVAHGFYTPVESSHIYGVTHYWSHDDELGCRFDDPDLGLSWPNLNPVLSPRDAEAPKLAELLSLMPEYQPN